MTTSVTTAEMRALEAEAPSGVNLMQNAGHAIAAAILRNPGSLGVRSVVVLVGPGDNGGDALIAAARLAAAGARVTAWASRQRPDDALVTAATARGVRWRVWSGEPRPLADDVRQASCLVDGLLGIGSSPPLRGPIADILAALPAETGQMRFAVDIPSGIDAETGAVDPSAFRADVTLSTGPLKIGALLHPAVEFAGRQIALDIGLPAQAYAPLRTSRIGARTARRLLPVRPLDGHKGTFGRLAIVAGSSRYRGAAALATVAAFARRCRPGHPRVGRTRLRRHRRPGAGRNVRAASEHSVRPSGGRSRRRGGIAVSTQRTLARSWPGP